MVRTPRLMHLMLSQCKHAPAGTHSKPRNYYSACEHILFSYVMIFFLYLLALLSRITANNKDTVVSLSPGEAYFWLPTSYSPFLSSFYLSDRLNKINYSCSACFLFSKDYFPCDSNSCLHSQIRPLPRSHQ